MLSIDFNRSLCFIDGSPLTDEKGSTQSIGLELGNLLALCRSGNPLKLWNWATTLGSKKPLTLDEADTQDLKRIIEESEASILFKGQALELIRAAESKQLADRSELN